MKRYIQYLKEASPIKLKELPKDKMAFLKKHKIDKKVLSTFDGIHGFITMYGTTGLDVLRLTKDDLKKIINDKNFRWLDVMSIGF